MDRKRRHERNFTHLYLGLSGIVALAAFVNLVSPDSLPLIGIFLALLTVFLFLLLLFILNNARHALLISSAVTLLLILRAFGLRNPIYPVLLAAAVISLEFVLRKR